MDRSVLLQNTFFKHILNIVEVKLQHPNYTIPLLHEQNTNQTSKSSNDQPNLPLPNPSSQSYPNKKKKPYE